MISFLINVDCNKTGKQPTKTSYRFSTDWIRLPMGQAIHSVSTLEADHAMYTPCQVNMYDTSLNMSKKKTKQHLELDNKMSVTQNSHFKPLFQNKTLHISSLPLNPKRSGAYRKYGSMQKDPMWERTLEMTSTLMDHKHESKLRSMRFHYHPISFPRAELEMG